MNFKSRWYSRIDWDDVMLTVFKGIGNLALLGIAVLIWITVFALIFDLRLPK